MAASEGACNATDDVANGAAKQVAAELSLNSVTAEGALSTTAGAVADASVSSDAVAVRLRPLAEDNEVS